MDEPLDLVTLAGDENPTIARLAMACAYWMRLARRRRRSHEANAYYWGVVVRSIAEHTGDTEQDVHAALRDRYLPPGELSTSGLDTVRYSHYLEHCIVAAATLGVLIPYPAEVTPVLPAGGAAR
jgi:hypothetical protein